MKENIDYLYLPKIQFNDMLNEGNVYKGKAFFTKKYFFLLVDRVDNVVATNKNEFYNVEYINAALKDMESVDLVSFEAEILSQIPEEYVYPFANLDKFEVNVGFFVFGGIRVKKRGKKITSATIGNAKTRQLVKDFYDNQVK